MNKKTIRDIDLKDKRVILRVDFNVPLENGEITDDTRIKAALPTIKYILERAKNLIIMSHLGRPGGMYNMHYKLDPVAKRLSELLNRPVKKLRDCIGEEVKKAISEMKQGDIVLLENLRFHKEEKKDDPEFAATLASYADIYVNDAFGCAHRAHASVHAITKYLPAVAGFLIEKELEFLHKLMQKPEKPFFTILGGAKVSSKIGLIQNIINKVDKILIGGGMAYTFLKAQGLDVGKSIVEEDFVLKAKELLETYKDKIVLPVDILVGDKFAPDANFKVVSIDEIPSSWQGMDIGPKTIEKFKKELEPAKTILWNGPLGVFEFMKCARGTFEIGTFISRLDCISVIGGGDSVAALKKAGLAGKFTHESTGGGASLELLEGKELPGIAALLDKEEEACAG